MFTEKDLRELVDHQAQQSMLTIYLNTDPSMGNTDSYRLRLRNMLKSVELAADVKKVEEYFDIIADKSWSNINIKFDEEDNMYWDIIV